MNILAIDIGGTMIKYGIVSSDGQILSTDKIETEAEKGLDNILNKIDNIFKKYKENNLVGIAVSGTGQINGMIGKVIGGAPIIPNWIGCNLVDILEKKYNLPAILENDVNCMALGEKWIGSGKDLNNFICLTIGTGIGGGIILNNELFRGENFVAGEFGHILIKKGEFQDFASTTALIRLTREKTGKLLNGEEIFNLEKIYFKEYPIQTIVRGVKYQESPYFKLHFIFKDEKYADFGLMLDNNKAKEILKEIRNFLNMNYTNM